MLEKLIIKKKVNNYALDIVKMSRAEHQAMLLIFLGLGRFLKNFVYWITGRVLRENNRIKKHKYLQKKPA